VKGITIEIDKLTNSLEHVLTGESFDTEVILAKSSEIKSEDWTFNWIKEINNNSRKVFKLTIKEDIDTIQGLVSFEIRQGHIFLHLVESANFNKGKNKVFLGVAGNLFAYTCKCSFDLNFDGFISFISKTALKEHYTNSLGAKVLYGDTMVIETPEAIKLVKQYFNK
jgi:hypothetical protein